MKSDSSKVFCDWIFSRKFSENLRKIRFMEKFYVTASEIPVLLLYAFS